MDYASDMALIDAQIALTGLDRRIPEFFISEALWHGDLLVLCRAQDILRSLGEADRVAPTALKEVLLNGRA